MPSTRRPVASTARRTRFIELVRETATRLPATHGRDRRSGRPVGTRIAPRRAGGGDPVPEGTESPAG